VWALVIGFLVWGDVPTVALLIGSGIVVGCGLFLLWHESKGKSRPQARPATAPTAELLQSRAEPGDRTRAPGEALEPGR
jgi:hypothetical protein